MKVTLNMTEVQTAVRDYLRDQGLEPEATATVAADGTYSAEVTKYVVPIQPTPTAANTSLAANTFQRGQGVLGGTPE